MRSIFFTFILATVGLTSYSQKQVEQTYKHAIDKIIVDTLGGGEHAFLTKFGHPINKYDILVEDTLSALINDRKLSNIEILGSLNIDSAIYYYFVEKVNKDLVLSAIVFDKFDKERNKVSEIYVFREKLLTYYFDEHFHLFFYDEKVNLLNIVAINGEEVIFEKSIFNKMPFFADHINKTNPIIPIDSDLPVGLFKSSFKNKLYKERDKFIFTFDMYTESFESPFKYGNATEILEVDLLNDISNYTVQRGPEDEEINGHNSFYLHGTLYRISVSSIYINIAAYDVVSKSLINQHAIYSHDTLGKMASSPYYLRSTRVLELEEFRNTKKLIKAFQFVAPSISAFNLDKHSVQLTIGYNFNPEVPILFFNGASLLQSVIISAFLTAIVDTGTGYGNYFYSNFKKDKFTFLPEKTNTLSQNVDDIEVGLIKNKNRMNAKTYFSSSDKIKFIYQDHDSKQLHIIE